MDLQQTSVFLLGDRLALASLHDLVRRALSLCRFLLLLLQGNTA